MSITRSLLRQILAEEVEKAKKLPSHFGSGKNITVFGYRTKHFDICLSAEVLFKDIKDELKGVNLDGVKKMVAKAAQLSDKIFGIEKRVVNRGSATKEECNQSEELNDQLKACMKKILGDKTTKKIGYMSMHLREIRKRKDK